MPQIQGVTGPFALSFKIRRHLNATTLLDSNIRCSPNARIVRRSPGGSRLHIKLASMSQGLGQKEALTKAPLDPALPAGLEGSRPVKAGLAKVYTEAR